jgi:hypothetical protein
MDAVRVRKNSRSSGLNRASAAILKMSFFPAGESPQQNATLARRLSGPPPQERPADKADLALPGPPTAGKGQGHGTVMLVLE